MSDLLPAADDLDRLPTFALRFGLDDVAEPTAVTVYSPALDEVDTHWLTIDVEWAIDLREVV